MNTPLRRSEDDTCGCEKSLYHQCTFQADPDIAGIGVLLSFVIVAVLTYAIVVYTYFFRPGVYRVDSFNRLDDAVVSTVRASLLWLRDIFHLKGPSARHFRSQNLQKTTSENTTQVTKRSLCPGHGSSTGMNKTDEAFFSILLALSDQQLFTGFAVLTVAYVQMNSITSYHAAVVECMATLAFVVYESASTIMYDQLRHPDKFFKMTWRAILILSFSALLLVTQLPLGNQYWLRAFGKQYKCFWRSFHGNYWPWDNAQNVFSMVFHIFCISLGISNTLANYFPRVFGWVNTNVVSSYIRFTIAKTALLPRRLHSSSLKKLRETDVKISRIAWTVFGAISHAAAFFSFILVELFTSQALNLLNHWYLIVSSVFWGFYYRIQAPYEGREGDEDKWGFGQAVPLFLVALPLFTLLEVVYDAFRLRRARNKTPPDSFSMQNLTTPSYATSMTEEPRPVDAVVGTPSVRSSGSQVTVNSAVQRNRPLPHQNRLDTEEGGHVSTQGQAANLDGSRQGSVCVCNQEYYWGYDVGLAEREEMWEDKLYRRWDFKAVLLGLLLGLMVLVTIAAIYWL